VNGFIALGPIPEGRGAASCRPLRSWPLGQRLDRVPAMPDPRPNYPQCISAHLDQAMFVSLALARRLALATANFCRLAAQMASARPASLSAGVM